MNELTSIPEPTGREPEYAQKAILALKEEARLTQERVKVTGLKVVEDITNWAADLLAGKEKIYHYTNQGQAIELSPHKYLFDNSSQLKALAGTAEIYAGKQETRSEIHLAILGRGKQAPRKLTPEEVVEIEGSDEQS